MKRRHYFIALSLVCVAIFAYRLLCVEDIDRDAKWELYHRELVDYVKESSVVRPMDMSEDRSVADELAKTVRVLCWVLTQPKHFRKAKHINATWGKRCSVLLFMSSREDEAPHTIKLPVSEGENNIWAKTKAAFRYVYEHHRRDADWFMKADDDTYVVLENLRYMLADHDTNSAIYFGLRYRSVTKQGYMSGGAGYVLSKKALEMFVRRGLASPRLCSARDAGAEDAEMGICLNNIGVKAMDSRDASLRGRMFAFPPRQALFPDLGLDWFWENIYYPVDQGLDCCSNYAISFHYIDIENMYLLEYFVYHIRPYGIHFKTSNLPILLQAHHKQNAILTEPSKPQELNRNRRENKNSSKVRERIRPNKETVTLASKSSDYKFTGHKSRHRVKLKAAVGKVAKRMTHVTSESTTVSIQTSLC